MSDKHDTLVGCAAIPTLETEVDTSPALCVLQGPEAGRVIRLRGGRAVIGRGDEAKIVLDYGDVSRAHAEVFVKGDGRVWIADLQSTNGTRVNGLLIGSLARPLNEGDRVQIGGVLLKLLYQDVLEAQLHQSLYAAAARDSLTGAYNKRSLEERLEQEFSHSSRHGTPLALVMFDLDHFKRVNDSYGHPAGDSVLQSTAAIVQGKIRRSDVFARYGGEEFVLLMRDTTLDQAQVVVERIRRLIADNAVAVGSATVSVTISTGVTERTCGAYRTAADMLARADQLLYRAKHAGRNRSCYDTAA